TLGLCIASGWPLSDSVQLANIASGLEVARQGVAVITHTELFEAMQHTAWANPQPSATAPSLLSSLNPQPTAQASSLLSSLNPQPTAQASSLLSSLNPHPT